MLELHPHSVAVRGAHLIDGAFLEEGATITVLRPSDAQPQGVVPVADAATVDRAVRGARQAVRESGWATRPPRERARVLRRWAALVKKDAEALARLEAVGSTRPVRDALAWDVPFTAEGLRFFAELADKHGGEVAATRADHLRMVIAEPHGVVAAIAP